MIILGVDTAIRCTGYGVIEMSSMRDIKVLDCGVIKNPPKMLHSECLRRLSGGVKELIDAFSPNVVSLESAFHGRNVKTAMILSMARGAVIATAATAGLPIYSYSPRSAKKAVVGTGSASKEQVAGLLAAICSLNVKHIPDDATDALALAVCHGQLAIRPELKDLLTKQI